MSEKIQLPNLTQNQVAAIVEWQTLTKWLKEAKEREQGLREFIVGTISAGQQLEEGTTTFTTEDGWKIKVVSKINRKLDETALEAVMNALPEDSEYRRLGVLIKYVPELVLAGYRTLPEDQKLIFSQCLTETEGSKTLEVLFAQPENEFKPVDNWLARNGEPQQEQPVQPVQPVEQETKKTRKKKK